MAIIAEDEAFLGTEKKYVIDIKSQGFDMDTDDFEVVLKRGGNTLTFHKSDLLKDEEDNWYIAFNTAALGAGTVSITVTAHVPDTDFPDGLRDEVDKFNFLRIKSV